jgi:hypothetical protein
MAALTAKVPRPTGMNADVNPNLQAFDELNEHPIEVGGDNAPDALPEDLRLTAQESDALLPQSRRCRVDGRSECPVLTISA